MSASHKVRITKELLDAATGASPWDVGNGVLYDLCRRYPAHRRVDEIVAKLWLIGRTYAAAIERRRVKTAFTGDAFYIDYVAPKLIAWNIDRSLSGLAGHSDIDDASLAGILSAHRALTDAFCKLTRLDKRSLASKYLHFHYPHLFFIYDTRADAALRRLSVPHNGKAVADGDADRVYRVFCLKCLALRDEVETAHGVRLTPRHLDNLLLAVAH